MVDTKQTVTNIEDNGINENGAAVQQQTRQIHTETAADPSTVGQNIVRFIVGVILTLLALRFIFKLTGANPASGFVNFVYALSGVLTAPFDAIFGVAATNAGGVRSVFEPSILVAALIYALIGWGIIKLITLNRPRQASSLS